ncbi:DUF3105 domain-containing protein [Halomicrobium salinisoli]|uniref:DUF3105 domain-containing protein n=1 Tax=Halomicrobium salinisoli TaxID=2878391 RepID=UPI001CF0AE46|nr:DUF3105 domain-containing protein [Halomicrobium salinisoli]
MVDCDYCDAAFEDEDTYLAHLADAHEGELSAIDRRRVEDVEREESGGIPTGPAVLAVVILASLALMAYVTLIMGGGGGNADASIPARGDAAVISQVENESIASNEHVSQGTDIDYERMPPTGGAHYGGQTVSAGFYEAEQSLGALVHSLEHGAVVVYYDPAALDRSAEQSLRAFANRHTGGWRSFIAVPNPAESPDAPYVLAAWGHRLEMNEYDNETVRQFTGEYLGRGPENPVR